MSLLLPSLKIYKTAVLVLGLSVQNWNQYRQITTKGFCNRLFVNIKVFGDVDQLIKFHPKFFNVRGILLKLVCCF